MFFSFKIKKSLAGLIGGLLVAGIATAVSYTHLDVYKRQDKCFQETGIVL